jgi:hypothetical protein
MVSSVFSNPCRPWFGARKVVERFAPVPLGSDDDIKVCAQSLPLLSACLVSISKPDEL